MARQPVNRCRKCAAPLQRDARLCIECGTYVASGIHVKTIARVKTAGRVAQAAVIAGLAAAFCGAFWAFLAVALSFEAEWMAWGIGWVTGGTMIGISQEQSERVGAYAAGLACLGILLGKAGMVCFGDIPGFAGIGAVFSWWDVLWGLLAIGTAFKVGAGWEDDD